jgi:hypothetical protein
MEHGDKQQLLAALASEAEELGCRQYDAGCDALLYRLKDRVKAVAGQLFPADHWLLAELPQVVYAPTAWPASKDDYQAALQSGTAKLAGLLRSAADTLGVQELTRTALAGQFGLGPAPARPVVFVSHSADDVMLAAMVQQLGNMGLQPLVLHDVAGGVLPALAGHSPVFAVVLLAAGPAQSTPAVLVELGYYWGKLGLDRVLCFLRESAGSALPADYLGTACRVFDEHGAWRELLRQALAKAGVL